METKFKVGDAVRIGGRIPSTDINYHARGVVTKISNGHPVVKIFDKWINPYKEDSNPVIVDWLSADCWELYESDFPRFEQLL